MSKTPNLLSYSLSPKLLRNIPLAFLLALLTTGCGENSLLKHIEFQDTASAGAKYPRNASPLTISEDVNVEVERGLFGDVYSAHIVAGQYQPIIRTDTGMFYLAPWEGFAYKANTRTSYNIGGIFLRDWDDRAYIWFLPEQRLKTHWEAWREGRHIDKVIPGFLSIPLRPWIEKDLIVPEKFIKTNQG